MNKKQRRRYLREAKNLNHEKQIEADKWIKNEPQKFIRLYVKNYWFSRHMSTTFKNWRKNGKRDQCKFVRKACKNIPDYINAFCNLIYVLKTHYQHIPSDKVFEVAEVLFYKYEPIVRARVEFKFGHVNDENQDYIKKYMDKGTPEQIRAEQKARGFIPFSEFEFEEDGSYLVNFEEKVVYPRDFDNHPNSLDIDNPGVYMAQSMYGYVCGIVMGKKWDFNGDHVNKRRILLKS